MADASITDLISGVSGIPFQVASLTEENVRPVATNTLIRDILRSVRWPGWGPVNGVGRPCGSGSAEKGRSSKF